MCFVAHARRLYIILAESQANLADEWIYNFSPVCWGCFRTFTSLTLYYIKTNHPSQDYVVCLTSANLKTAKCHKSEVGGLEVQGSITISTAAE